MPGTWNSRNRVFSSALRGCIPPTCLQPKTEQTRPEQARGQAPGRRHHKAPRSREGSAAAAAVAYAASGSKWVEGYHVGTHRWPIIKMLTPELGPFPLFVEMPLGFVECDVHPGMASPVGLSPGPYPT
ncbi:uncharacterized protein ColSpa_05844 [Colletotrichum spaethianum]|uniref:Uncharacterized protein n=1 Tax=Colletotrichum spaethianum TaxID=700344 RepID=A0AA37LFR7_9PEZI|nr:uncharacterized protein ColSpa_05844 [Colletotrichum spaethianum]GKT45663.1 hypothetical protein ColSpa_05844 [Colletotrichum spaethianum]